MKTTNDLTKLWNDSGKFEGIGTGSSARRSSTAILVTMILAGALTRVSGQVPSVWSGGDSNDAKWTSNDNWAGVGGAGPGDKLSFPGGASRRNNTNDFPVNTPFASIEFSGDNCDYVVNGNQILLQASPNVGLSANVTSGTGPIFNPNLLFGVNGVITQKNSHPSAFTLNGVVNPNTHSLELKTDFAGNVININGLINGSGTITKTGPGSVTFANNNSYTGLTQINGGTLFLGASNSLGAAGSANKTVVASGATLALFGNGLSVPESLTLNGTGANNTGALRTGGGCDAGCSVTGTVNLGSNSTIYVVATAETLSLTSSIGGGAFGLTKIGSGTLILSASNTYSGTTSITAGTLLVNGNIANSLFHVTGNGTLGGTGTVGPITAAGGTITLAAGTIAPGNSTGVLNSSGDVTFESATTYEVEIGGGPASGDFDRLEVNGTASLGGGVLKLTLLNGFLPGPNARFTILASQSPIAEDFSNVASGARLQTEDGSGSFVVTYHVVNNALLSRNVTLSNFRRTGQITVSVTVPPAQQEIHEGETATFIIHASPAPAEALTVQYAMSGKAKRGDDYTLTLPPGQLTIPAGQASATGVLQALKDQHPEEREGAIMTLLDGTGYQLTEPTSAKVKIVPR